jgi:hypothetical protein
MNTIDKNNKSYATLKVNLMLLQNPNFIIEKQRNYKSLMTFKKKILCLLEVTKNEMTKCCLVKPRKHQIS